MNIMSYFSDKSVPKTGLSPVMDIWKVDGTRIITAGVMIEIGGGFYVYNFVAYDDDQEYAYRSDGGATQQPEERYVVGTNEVGQSKDNSRNILKIEKNKLIVNADDNTLTIYDDDNITPLFVFDLKDKVGDPSAINIFRRIPR